MLPSNATRAFLHHPLLRSLLHEPSRRWRRRSTSTGRRRRGRGRTSSRWRRRRRPRKRRQHLGAVARRRRHAVVVVDVVRLRFGRRRRRFIGRGLGPSSARDGFQSARGGLARGLARGLELGRAAGLCCRSVAALSCGLGRARRLCASDESADGGEGTMMKFRTRARASATARARPRPIGTVRSLISYPCSAPGSSPLQIPRSRRISSKTLNTTSDTTVAPTSIGASRPTGETAARRRPSSRKA